MRKKSDTHQRITIEDAGRLSLLSHDVRSIYAELQSGIARARDALVGAEHASDLQRLYETGAHLGKLLDEVSSLVFKDHLLHPRTAPVSKPRATLRSLADRWGSALKRLGRQLVTQNFDALPEYAALDMLAVERVLSNLLSNALRHTESPIVTLSIDRREDIDGQHLIIKVTDTGAGFPPEVLAKEALSRPIPIGAGEPGSGYGLRVAFGAARQLGGTLTISNTAGGAVAHLELPLRDAEPGPSVVPHFNQDARAEFRGFRALVVEDSDPLRHVLSTRLKNLGFDVIEARDGSEALDLLSQSGLDLAFLDVELPILSGLQVLELLRERGILPPPIIAVSAHVFPANMAAIQAAGAHEILSKPLPPTSELVDVLRSALRIENGPMLRHNQCTAASPRDALAALLLTLHPEDGRNFLESLDKDFALYGNRLSKICAQPLTTQSRLMLENTAHCLAGLFATAYDTAAQHTAQHVYAFHETLPHAELIALCGELRQSVSNIRTTVQQLIQSETDEHVQNTDFNRR